MCFWERRFPECPCRSEARSRRCTRYPGVVQIHTSFRTSMAGRHRLCHKRNHPFFFRTILRHKLLLRLLLLLLLSSPKQRDTPRQQRAGFWSRTPCSFVGVVNFSRGNNFGCARCCDCCRCCTYCCHCCCL